MATATPSSTAVGRSDPPYVGPRSYTRDDVAQGRRLYGRDADAAKLSDLVISKRIVLLYSPSGAGKTSLIQAKILKQVEEEKIVPLPIVRVGREPRKGAGGESARNRYVASALECLGADPSDATLSLHGYLANLQDSARHEKGTDFQLVVFDQFEEVLLVDPTDLEAKKEFFHELGVALRNRDRWALFAMREDHVAGLDPYLGLLPTRLSTTLRLDLLSTDAALKAIVEPARERGVDLGPVAPELVKELSETRVQGPDGTMELRDGPSVEPMQLQVVCLDLWQKKVLPGTTRVELEELDSSQSVDQALESYYRAEVERTAQQTGVSQRAIRMWFGRELITPRGIRNEVLQEAEKTRGLANSAILALEDAHLVHGERRRGLTWYELSHDRLIAPIRQDNARWFRNNATDVQRTAQDWESAGRPARLLVTAPRELKEATAWAASHADEVSEVEREFLEASRREVASRIWTWRLVALASACAALVMVVLFHQGQVDRAVANSDRLASSARTYLQDDPARSLGLALDAVNAVADPQPLVQEVLRNALSESHQRAQKTVGGRVYAAAFSPDGVAIATAGSDGLARVWQLDGSAAPVVLKPPPGATDTASGPLTVVIFSPNGRFLVAAGFASTAWLWDLSAATQQPLALDGHTGLVTDAAFSPDGTSIVTASADGTARVWDTRTGESLRDPLVSDQGAVQSAAFSPDGTRIVTAGSDGTARIWDAAGGQPLGVLRGHVGTVLDAAFSPDGNLLVTAGEDKTAHVWDARMGVQLAELRGHTDVARTARFNPSGNLIVTSSDDRTARLWDVRTYLSTTVFRGHQGAVREATFDPSGSRVITASDDGTVRQWDAGEGAARTFRDAPGAGNDVVPVFDVAFSPSGKYVATASGDGIVRVWDTATSARVAQLRGQSGAVYSAAFSPDDERLVVTAGGDGSARVWEWGSQTSAVRVVHPGSTRPLTSAVFSPDGALILTASFDKSARLWDAHSGNQQEPPLLGHTDGLTSAAFSPDGSQIVTASLDGTARVWDAPTHAQLLVLKHEGAVRSAAFSPDKSTIVTSSADGTVRLWDARSGDEVTKWSGSTGPVNSARFSRDGRFIVTASVDGTARVWGASSGVQLSVLHPPGGKVYDATFDPSGQMIATADEDGTARVFLCDACASLEQLKTVARTRLDAMKVLTGS